MPEAREVAGVSPRTARAPLSFRTVNRRDAPGYEPGVQRHHLLPRQLLRQHGLRPLLKALGRERLCLDDFRHNGLLLPANDAAAVRLGLPLHRGPHRSYNEMVIERVGQIEQGWAAGRQRSPAASLYDALEQLGRLQHALRRRLLDQQRQLRLNRHDPLGSGVNFAEIDAMAALLWPATEPAQ